jgi:hypothetical protein
MDEHPEAVENRGAKGRIVASLGLFLAGFVLTAAALHETIRTPLRLYADIRSEKLAIMDAWRGKALSAAFGSSHMHNGFDPRAFDEALSGTSLETHSINGSVAGGSQTEQRVMALEFLRGMKPPALDGSPHACFVLLEITAGANFTDDHLVHPRAINIYDWNTLRFVSRLTDSGMDRKQRLGRVAYAVMGTALHYMNVGMVSNRIFSPPMDAGIIARETEQNRRGLEAGKMTQAQQDEMAMKFARVREEKVREPLPVALLPGNYALLQELKQASPVKNLQVLYAVMPMLGDIAQRREYPATIAGPDGPKPILNLARPDLYPYLFQPKYWADEAHLNEAGAAIGSRLLAEQIKAWYGANPAAAQCGESSDRKRGG